MATLNCAISGLSLRVDHLPVTIQSYLGYYHPIFALPRPRLEALYSKHCQGHLTHTDSYLLLLAYLHSSGKVDWTVPCSLSPSSPDTISLVENNMRSLIEIVELTATVEHPAFKQPALRINSSNCNLENLGGWIEAWNHNLNSFRIGYREERIAEALKKVENRLTQAILSGADKREYPHIIASWAAKAAGFPTARTEEWQKVIRSCFNSEKMFSTPLPILREIKSYCEENIEAGSIHFHTLYATLKEGISRHTDFLGLSPIALGYTLLPIDSTKNDAEIASILSNAPSSVPHRRDYTSEIEYIKAKLRYAVSKRNSAAERETEGEEL